MGSGERLQEQIEYYRQRASQYDEWFFRKGRYDRGEEVNRAWFDEIEVVRDQLRSFNLIGDGLELAGGTGLWTQVLAPMARHLTVVDASPEVIEINRDRVGADSVQYVLADLFAWEPDRTYDFVFFSFWLSHVPSDEFERFWVKVGKALNPGGRAYLIDSKFERLSGARNHVLGNDLEQTVTRKLNDGKEFEIVKIFYESEGLSEKLARLGWQSDLRETERFFIYGSATLG